MNNHKAHESEIQRELNRRLDLVLQDEYGDPARTDISGWELVLWFAFAMIIPAATVIVRSGV